MDNHSLEEVEQVLANALGNGEEDEQLILILLDVLQILLSKNERHLSR